MGILVFHSPLIELNAYNTAVLSEGDMLHFLDWISKKCYEKLLSSERPGPFMWQNIPFGAGTYQNSEPFPILHYSEPSLRPRTVCLQKCSINNRKNSFLSII